ncbi:hypothetical protein BD414DRAFT_436966 [Trametes punicea]|nr:hypothetical protein BD414DRAFT_436966 [Trametes punicea]
MSLLTPPSTSHRDEKENRAPRFARVSWCDTAEYHAITASPPRTVSAQPSASRTCPSRSILKKSSYSLAPIFDENAKEGTPEPSDPLADLHYLERPISRIVAQDASLRDLIEAYSILAARLRVCVTDNTDADASWPLFQPIRKQRDMLVEAFVRDICRVFMDPVEERPASTDPITSPRVERSSLPSPRDSPKKKRGMSAEQVKRARDLCGVCHAVLRLLSLVFTLPALYQLFTEEELGYILTQVLAIPLAHELPTPNARKTCALAIWLIQTQRLPAEVLKPAKDRITYALRRGIEGELGKEGKKGSASDGLKAIHDLSLHQPSIFVPAFVPLLPAVLSNLLAPTLVLRNQACHALGGYALAVASLPPSEVHTRVSTVVAARLVKQVDTNGPLSPLRKAALASPSKDSLLVRTLRTTLQATEPKHAAQGPVWAFSVIAHLIVLLGPTVFLHNELTRVIMALFSLGMRHPKSSIRGLGCLAWRAMTWAYFRPPHVKLTITTETDDEDAESATEDDLIEERKRHEQALLASFKYLPAVIDMGAGISTIGALLGQEFTDDIHIRGALRVLRAMSKKGGQTCKDAMDVAQHLLGSASSPHQPLVPDWEHRKLLPPGLFSANPGLLTAEWKTLSASVKGVLEQCPQVTDIRPLTLEEIATEGLWDEFLAVWKDGLSVLRLQWGSEEVPTEVREIWFNLLKAHTAPLLDADDHDGLVELATRARDILLEILDHDGFDFTMRGEEVGDEVPTSPVKETSSRAKANDGGEPLPEHRWNYAVKLFLVRDLFTIARTVFPGDIFVGIAESILKYLNSNEENLVGDMQCTDEVREQWASLCAEAALACDTGVMQGFWENKLGNFSSGRRVSHWNVDVRAVVWQTFLDRWADGKKSWEAATVLLSVPFVEVSGWELASDELNAWDDFLKRSIDSALDCGVDAPAFIDHVASAVAAGQSPGTMSSVRIADLLLSNLEFSDAREVPTELLEFASDTLNASYPPAPRHKVMCVWLVRSLTRVMDACPTELCFSALQCLSDGLCTWFADEYDSCSVSEYSSDILPLYQTVLLSIQALQTNVRILEALAPLLEAPFRSRQDKHVGVIEAFAGFWQETYARLPEPPSGWPEQILRCLEAVAREREDEASVENLTAIQEDCPSPCGSDSWLSRKDVQWGPADVNNQAEYESEEESSVELHTPGTFSSLTELLLRPAVCPRSVSPERVSLREPSTPKSSPRAHQLNTLPHAHDAVIQESDTKDLAVMCPGSPTMGSYPRVPTTPEHSPSKADANTGSGRSNGTRNKENQSPRPRIATVAERLAVRSPLLLEPVLGKRPRVENVEDQDDLGKAFKRSRLDISPLTSSATILNMAQVNLVAHEAPDVLDESSPSQSALSKVVIEETELLKSDNSSNLTENSESSWAMRSTGSLCRKRKGVFLDAVVVPPVNEVFREKRRFDVGGPSLSLDNTAPAEPKAPALRRTRSATKLLGEQADFLRLENTPKRRRMVRTQQLREAAVSEQMSSPSRTLQDAQLFGSDDSIMFASPSRAADLPPSDDDPHPGQLTPHSLVSPALRRVRHVELNSDPPSDDSIISTSPSSERVVRKIARLGNVQSAQPTPLNIRPRSMNEFSSFSALGNEL